MNQVGKRYECPTCGLKVICVKPGDGTLRCHSEDMAMMESKPLPSSD